jgi:hypothetical protein
MSTRISYDMRYEAYEFQCLDEHSIYTDIFAYVAAMAGSWSQKYAILT